MSLLKRIEPFATVLLTMCALVLTVGYVRREFLTSASTKSPLPTEQVDDWRSYAVGNMEFGAKDASLHIVEFSDFECPACRRLFRTVRALRERDSLAVRVTYRNYPLDDLHPSARPAALAAQCAADQGAFERMHDYLFEHQSTLDGMNWTAVAATVGVTDTTRFRACLVDPTTLAKLSADSLDAKRLAVDGTPLVLIDSVMMRGAPRAALLDSLLMLRRGGTR